MTTTALSLLMYFYLGTTILNIGISLTQFISSRSQLQKLILLYWIGVFVSSVANGMVSTHSLPVVLISSIGTFISQMILSLLLTRLHSFRLPYSFLFSAYAAGLIVTYYLWSIGSSFAAYALPAIASSVISFPYAAYIAIKKKQYSIPITQKLFIGTGLILTLHFIDWPFFRENPNFFLPGAIFAFALYHIVAILTPMIATEYDLMRRTRTLEAEVATKAADLTEAQRRLWESNKLASIGRLAGGVAHELNTPLAVIQGNVEVIREHYLHQTPAPPAPLESCAQIEKTVSKISKITMELRRLARDQFLESSREYNFVPIIKEAISDLLPKAQRLKSGLDLHIDTSHDISIICSRQDIHSLLYNLIDNALDAVENLDERKVLVTLKYQKNIAQVTVEDTGRIPHELTSLIMEPFFTTKPVGRGTGLGLSTARSIAENHNGRLYLDSKASNTKFIFEIPIYNGG